MCVCDTLCEKAIGRRFEPEQVKELSQCIRVGRHAIVRLDALSDYATDIQFMLSVSD